MPGGTRSYSLRTRDGRTRSYLVHAPVPARRGPLPVLLMFHGAGDSAPSAERQTGLDATADAHGFLVVYPQGVEHIWSVGAGPTLPGHAGVDDVAFVTQLLARLGTQYPIDRARVSAAGFSDGALLVELLGCRLASVFNLIAPASGQLPAKVAARCRPDAPLSVLEFHGTKDPTLPYAGADLHVGGSVLQLLSVAQSQAVWARNDGCPKRQPARTITAAVTETGYAGCSAGVTVTLFTTRGGAHDWPGTASFAANEQIWTAMRRHRRR